jgi:hypothetical protein
MQMDFMTPNSNETQNFDGELQISNQHMKNKPYKV